MTKALQTTTTLSFEDSNIDKDNPKFNFEFTLTHANWGEQHSKVKENYVEKIENKKGPSEVDAVTGLMKNHPDKYSTLMTDLAMGA